MASHNRWMEGLHYYNKGSDEWCIPRKGTDRYNDIMGRIRRPVSKPESDERKSRGERRPRIHRSHSPRHPHGGKRHRSNSPRHPMRTTYHKPERKARSAVLPSQSKNPLVYDKETGLYQKADRDVKYPRPAKNPLVYDKATGVYQKKGFVAPEEGVPVAEMAAPPMAGDDFDFYIPDNHQGERVLPINYAAPYMAVVPVLNMKPATDTQYGRRYRSRFPMLPAPEDIDLPLVPVLNMKPATDNEYGRRYRSRFPMLPAPDHPEIIQMIRGRRLTRAERQNLEKRLMQQDVPIFDKKGEEVFEKSEFRKALESSSASLLSSAVRRLKAQEMYSELVDEKKKDNNVDENTSLLIKIQSAIRVYMAKRQAEKKLDAINKIQGYWRDYKYRTTPSEEEVAAKVIQAKVRRSLANPEIMAKAVIDDMIKDLEYKEEAFKKLEKVMSSMIAQSDISPEVIKKEEIKEEKKQAKEIYEEKIKDLPVIESFSKSPEKDIEKEKKAAKKQAKKEAKKAAEDLAQLEMLLKAEMNKKQKEQERTAKIASITEKFKKKKENAAATIIQKMLTKKAKELPKAEEVPVVDTNKAATTLQAAVRGKLAKNEVNRVNDAITKLQSAIRNSNAKKTLEALKPKVETEIVEVKSDQGKKSGWGFSLSFISDAVKAVNDAVSNTVDEALKAREKGKAISRIQAGVRRNTAMIKYKEELKAYRLEVKALQDAQKALEAAKNRQEKVDAVVNVLSNTADKIKGGFGYLFGGRSSKTEQAQKEEAPKVEAPKTPEAPKVEAPKSREKTKEELDKEQREFDEFMANAQREYDERERKRKDEEEEAKRKAEGAVRTKKVLKGQEGGRWSKYQAKYSEMNDNFDDIYNTIINDKTFMESLKKDKQKQKSLNSKITAIIEEKKYKYRKQIEVDRLSPLIKKLLETEGLL